ncbi:hypothetical protein PanWU01x14_015980 [Parasponia andersonii]|uniref:Uncharacterized protein n=1 Tax=Parasponia andersonii TaxID=3476 RepID=A0A2P5E0P9_PARAD|nr:hypothetical protein PanWU01x14_015980 [Parasponia andersonii]
MSLEQPQGVPLEAFSLEVNAIKTTIKDYESYIKSLNEEIVIDESRLLQHRRGVL